MIPEEGGRGDKYEGRGSQLPTSQVLPRRAPRIACSPDIFTPPLVVLEEIFFTQ
jgi:hypothetical protein